MLDFFLLCMHLNIKDSSNDPLFFIYIKYIMKEFQQFYPWTFENYKFNLLKTTNKFIK